MRKKDFFLKWDSYRQYQFFLVAYLLLAISLVSFIDMEYARGNESTSPIEPGFKELTANATRLKLDKKMNGSVHIKEGSVEIDSFFFILPDDNFFKRYEIGLYIERTSKDNGSIFFYCVDENNDHFKEKNVINGTGKKNIGFFRDKIESEKVFLIIQGEGNYTIYRFEKIHTSNTLLKINIFLLILLIILWFSFMIIILIILIIVSFINKKNKSRKKSDITLKSIKDYNNFILKRKIIFKNKRNLLLLKWIFITILYFFIPTLFSINIFSKDYLESFLYISSLLILSLFLIILIIILFIAYKYEKKYGNLIKQYMNVEFNIYQERNDDEEFTEKIRSYRFVPYLLICVLFPSFLFIYYSFIEYNWLFCSFIILFLFSLLSFFGSITFLYQSLFTIVVSNKSIIFYRGFRDMNGAFSIKNKTINIKNILSINPELYSMPVMEFDSSYFGPRLERDYLIKGLMTVKIITKDDKIFYLRTNDPMRIVNFVRKRIT